MIICENNCNQYFLTYKYINVYKIIYRKKKIVFEFKSSSRLESSSSFKKLGSTRAFLSSLEICYTPEWSSCPVNTKFLPPATSYMDVGRHVHVKYLNQLF